MSRTPQRLGELRLTADTAELARLRAAVAAWAAGARLGDATAHRLVQAVDEAATNAIEHGLRGSARRVVVTAHRDADGLTVTVRHRGARFDPTAAPSLSGAEALRTRAVHGYGLLLIRRLVADVAYRYSRGVNEIRLTAR